MNYRHHFHAGNHADVLKHVALLELLRLLTAKDKPLAYLESHAGAGGYALGEEAEKTGEWRDGIGKLLSATDAPPAIRNYLNAVRAWNAGESGLRRYPGSPGLAADALRSQDRLRLCESQPAVATELKRRLADHDSRVQVFTADGYHQVLSALLPPPERRALVLIDPPYEAQVAEFDRIIGSLREGLQRFATGTYAIWYPIKLASSLAPFMRRVAALPVKSALTIELWVRAPDSPLRLNGSGLVVLNPPWRFDQEAATSWLPWLSRALADGRGAGWRCQWLRKESTGEASEPVERPTQPIRPRKR
jgi:23S rRNA (adenine2030-N6)-methyltransferase